MKRVSLLLTFFAAVTFFMVSCGGSEAPKKEADAVPEVEQNNEAATPATEEATETATEETTEAADVTANFDNGKAIYDKTCFACHSAGVAGAAKLDDKARWDATASKGIETVVANAINGYTGEHGVMPAKGGAAALTDDEVKDAVAYMLHTAGVTAE